MKKIFSMIILSATLLIIPAVSAYADTYTTDDFEYSVKDDGTIEINTYIHRN